MANILFICSANKDRSRSAEDYFREKHPQHSFDSAGTNEKICFQLGTSFLNVEQLAWADVIFVMEKKHKEFALNLAKSKKKIQILGIADRYAYYQKELLEILDQKVRL